MADELTPTTLRLYRRLRSGHPPEEAIALLREYVRTAREYALADGRIALDINLRSQVSHLTQWLQDVRLRADRDDRHGSYWRTGFLSNPLRYTVQAAYDDGRLSELIKCDNPGCAIKHALALFVDEAARYVFVTANRPGIGYTIGREATMQTLAGLSWPVA